MNKDKLICTVGSVLEYKVRSVSAIRPPDEMVETPGTAPGSATPIPQGV